MRIHSDFITATDIHAALSKAEELNNVSLHFEVMTSHNSRSRKAAFEVQLGTYSKVKGDKRGYKNSGQYGASDVYAATWTEWGIFFAELFKIDPAMNAGGKYGYKNADDYHKQTFGMFLTAEEFEEAYSIDPWPYVRKGDRFARRASQSIQEYAPGLYIYDPRI